LVTFISWDGNSSAASRFRGPARWHGGPYGWAQIATFGITGLAIVAFAVALRDQLPHRRASRVAVVLLALLGVALILAAFRVDTPMLSGGSPATWHGWVHAIACSLVAAQLELTTVAQSLRDQGSACAHAALGQQPNSYATSWSIVRRASTRG
jgi:Protein of unknown function (DUF998)